MATRWGIASAGKICRDFVTALQILPSSDHQVVAVAARSHDRAKEFASEFNIPIAYGSYEELSQDPNVEVVYIGTIHIYHAELCKMMLRAGKHVLCEKPLCMNEREVTEVIQVARENKRFLMEGYWSRFFPAYHRLREELAKGSIGEPKMISATFGFVNENNERLSQKELGGGAMLDIGCYTVQFVEQIFGGKPQKITAVGALQDTGVDKASVVTLMYPGDRMAVLTMSLESTMCQAGYVQGNKGFIQVPHFWCPTGLVVKDEKLEFPLPKCSKSVIYAHSEGLSYEAQHVREMLQKGALESPIMPLESSLNIIRIMDEARRQLGVTYESDRA